MNALPVRRLGKLLIWIGTCYLLLRPLRSAYAYNNDEAATVVLTFAYLPLITK